MPTEKPRYTIIVDNDLLEKIDDFRFENRYQSRSAATLELIRLIFHKKTALFELFWKVMGYGYLHVHYSFSTVI